jgi:hypothetical protein
MGAYMNAGAQKQQGPASLQALVLFGCGGKFGFMRPPINSVVVRLRLVLIGYNAHNTLYYKIKYNISDVTLKHNDNKTLVGSVTSANYKTF